MTSASSQPVPRIRSRRSWPVVGLTSALLVFAAGQVDPARAPARLAQAAGTLAPSWLGLSCAMACVLLAGAGWRAAQGVIGHRQRLVEQRIRGRLAERERIARDLHDNLLQGVLSLVLRVDASLQALPPGHAARGQIEEALGYADAVLQQTREQVLDLRGHRPQRELAEALEEAIRERHATSGTRTVLRVAVAGRPRPLRPAAWAELHAIGLEAVTNALRHAHAARVDLRLDYRRDAFVLSVRDDGKGIPAELLRCGARQGHHGLSSLRERARVLGRRLELIAPAGGGTVVTTRVAARTAYRQTGPELDASIAAV